METLWSWILWICLQMPTIVVIYGLLGNTIEAFCLSIITAILYGLEISKQEK